MMFEHKVANHYKSKPGKINVFLRWFTAWLILFGSKLYSKQAKIETLNEAVLIKM